SERRHDPNSNRSLARHDAGSKEPQPTMLMVLVLGLSVLALAVAWGLRGYVLRQDNGTADMRKISDAIQEGAEAFLRRQYRTIGTLSIALGVVIYVLYAFFRNPHPGEPAAGTLALTTTLSFLFGALCSGVAGIVGMYVAVRSNIRTASAARSSLNKALQIALRGGAVSGLFVVAMSLFGVGLLYTILEAMHFEPTKIPLMIVGYGFGASFVALFAQLGGGGDPGRRSAQPRRDRGPGGRQRGRLRGARRRSVRVDGRREHRRDDSGIGARAGEPWRLQSGAGGGVDAVPPRRPRLRTRGL